MNASQKFAQFVNDNRHGPGGDYGAAYRQTAEQHRDVYVLVRASGMTKQATELFNEKLTRQATAPARKQANERFAEMVNEAMEKSPSLTYDLAFAKVRRAYPELIGAGPKASFTNDAATAAANPAAGPQNLALLHLPASSSQEVFDAVFKANGRKFYPLRVGEMFDALVALQMEKGNLSYETAMTKAKRDFPDLWALCEEAAKS